MKINIKIMLKILLFYVQFAQIQIQGTIMVFLHVKAVKVFSNEQFKTTVNSVVISLVIVI